MANDDKCLRGTRKARQPHGLGGGASGVREAYKKAKTGGRGSLFKQAARLDRRARRAYGRLDPSVRLGIMLAANYGRGLAEKAIIRRALPGLSPTGSFIAQAALGAATDTAIARYQNAHMPRSRRTDLSRFYARTFASNVASELAQRFVSNQFHPDRQIALGAIRARRR